MKKYVLILLLFSLSTYAQEYVDILKVGYHKASDAEFEDSNTTTDIKRFEASITYPIVLSEKYAVISGIDYSNNEMLLSPNFNEQTSFYNTLLKIGLSTAYSEKWSSTLVLLPKLSSDYENLSSNDFFFGIYAIAKLKKNDNLAYRFGIYSSTEAFGLLATPIFGIYFNSPNKRLEIDASLPIKATITYSLGKASLGFDYLGISRSYNLNPQSSTALYVEQSPLEFASFIQFGVLNNSILLRAKVGYSSNTYKVYEQGDKLDFRMSGINFGDDRTQLNPTILGNTFFKFEAVYRVHLNK